MARILLSALAVAALAVAGCGDDDEAVRNPPNKMVRSAQVGQSIELKSAGGEPLRATVTSVQDPVRNHPYEKARIGGRFVGVELELANEGSITIRASPWSGARLSTSRGAATPTRRLLQGSCVRARRRVISPGATQRACIPFRVRKGAELLKFRLTPGGGFSEVAGVWDLSD